MIKCRGNPKSPIWIIVDSPYDKDTDKGYIWTGGFGYVWDELWKLSGITVEPYIYVLKPVPGASYHDAERYLNLIDMLNVCQPPLVITTSAPSTVYFVPDTKAKGNGKAILQKYVGSLLSCKHLRYPHYIVPCYPPDYIARQYTYKEIAAYIDLGHVREEFEYFQRNGVLQPLTQRSLLTEPSFYELMGYFEHILGEHASGRLKYVSTDIETIRPRKNSYYHALHHPGYPYTNSFAVSPFSAISYSLWDYPKDQLGRIWRRTGEILSKVPQIGQNYFNFDVTWFERLGFEPCLEKCQDTLIRHHNLWPALEHKLQFQTKQYTREPYYKDDGKQWSPKYKKQLMKYNCLDTCVTYEVFLKQEEEFQERPHLA